MKSKLVKIISMLVIGSSLFSVSASAAWNQNKTGWWYDEGNSYAVGWKLIDGNWYYFYSNGYMASNTFIDGYYLNKQGAWTKTTISLDKAKSIANSLIGNKYFGDIVVEYSNTETYLSKEQQEMYYSFYWGSSDGYGNMIDEADTNICINKYTGEIFIACPPDYTGDSSKIYSMQDFIDMINSYSS